MRALIRAITLVFIALSFMGLFLSRAESEKQSENGHNIASDSSDYNQRPGEIVVVEINGTINPATLDYIRTGLDAAKDKNAEALVILLDTPGGLLSSTKEIVKLILGSSIPVVVYVSPSGASATSAGVFITLSANIAAMAPGTSIGAAHPVTLGPEGNQRKKKIPEESKSSGREKSGDKTENTDQRAQRDVMNEKIENYASSFIQSIAEQRGRNVEWANLAVRESSSITANEALRLQVIDLISPDLGTLINEIDGRGVKLSRGDKTLRTKGTSISRVEMSAKQQLINILSTPDIAFLLLSLGSLGLLLEFYNPGLIFPGVTGVVCLLMGFVSLQILAFNHAGLVLLLLAIGLFVTEVYVTSYGLLSLGGIISFALGALLLFDTPESDVRVSFDVVIASTLAMGLFFAYVAYYLAKSQKLSPQLGFEGLKGEEGEAFSEVNKEGKVFIMGEYWDAESDELISKGDKIKVIKYVKGLKVRVKKIDV